MQWPFVFPELVIITNILEKYYGVSTLAVSWTSMIFMVTYIPLIFPASWFLQKKVQKRTSKGKASVYLRSDDNYDVFPLSE